MSLHSGLSAFTLSYPLVWVTIMDSISHSQYVTPPFERSIDRLCTYTYTESLESWAQWLDRNCTPPSRRRRDSVSTPKALLYSKLKVCSPKVMSTSLTGTWKSQSAGRNFSAWENRHKVTFWLSNNMESSSLLTFIDKIGSTIYSIKKF